MSIKIEQVNLAERETLTVGGRRLETGIFKRARPGRVAVGELGLEGDAVCDVRHHGGPDQAVYLYSHEDYAFWGTRLDEKPEPGTFGENLTTSGIDLSAICVGDRLASDDLELQVTAPRIPCNTLAARMGDKTFAKQFMQAGRSGAYCRVTRPGSAGAGDEFVHHRYEGDRVPLQTFFLDAKRKLTAEELDRYLALPIDERNRADFERQRRGS